MESRLTRDISQLRARFVGRNERKSNNIVYT